MAKKPLSPFYVDEASLPKRKPVTSKPASGMIAALYEEKKTCREKDDELRAMAARIAALQEAEKSADKKIQQAKTKAEKILAERSAANKVDYVHADEEASGSPRENAKAGRTGSGGGSGSSGSRGWSSKSGRLASASASGKGRPPSNPKAARLHGEAGKSGSPPASASPKAPKSRSVLRSNSEMSRDRRGDSSLNSTARRLSDGNLSSAGARSPSSGSGPKAARPRADSVDRRRQQQNGAAAASGSESPSSETRRRPSSDAQHKRGKEHQPSSSSSKSSSSNNKPYVHPALVDSDSDDDDGPSLADALTMPGLFCDGPGDGLDGLLARYADDEAQPLQSVMDAAKEGLDWAAEAESKLKASKNALKAPPPPSSSAWGGFVEVSGCVAEVGAGAWG